MISTNVETMASFSMVFYDRNVHPAFILETLQNYLLVLPFLNQSDLGLSFGFALGLGMTLAFGLITGTAFDLAGLDDAEDDEPPAFAPEDAPALAALGGRVLFIIG
jgi:hypothetical protein